MLHSCVSKYCNIYNKSIIYIYFDMKQINNVIFDRSYKINIDFKYMSETYIGL